MKTKKRNTHKKNKLSLYAALVLFLFIHYVVFPAPCALGDDLPSDPLVQAGDPTITSDGRDMTVNAGTYDKTWIDWQGGFNIAAGNSVNNIGPSAAAVILHNDVTGMISDIQGALNGNCNVFLLNPSGIIFGQGAQVNVGGLVVSTLNMSMDDFMSGDYKFKDENLVSMSAIVNSGIINSQNPSGVTLIAGAVRNEGVINANLGTVNLVSGKEVTLNINSEGSIQVAVNKEVLSNVYDKDGNRVSIGVDNVGDINANGGQVYIEAEAANDVFDTLINQSGVVKAGSMVEKDGKIVLVSNSEGDKAIIRNSGTLDVSAIEDGADGGKVEINGYRVLVDGTVKANALSNATAGDVTIVTKDQAVLWSDSLIEARGLGENANGGTVLVNPHPDVKWAEWGEVVTKFAPTAVISTLGGSEGAGNGFVELSGSTVNIQGAVYTGNLLIDPDTIEFTTAGPDANVAGFADFTEAFTDDNNTASVFRVDGTGTLATAAAGSTITFQADTLITVTNDFVLATATGDANVSLVLQSGQNIDINAAVTADGTGTITMEAEDNITIDGNITSGSGAISIQAEHADLGGDTAPLTADGALTLGSSADIASTSGQITLSVESGAGALTLGAGSTVSTTNAAVTLQQLGTGSIAIDTAADNAISAGNGTVTLNAAAGNITVTDAGANDEIVTTGSVVLTGAAIGAATPLSLNGATALTITDLDGAASHIQIEELTGSTIATTTITVPTATSGNIDINYFGANSVDINNGHVLNSIVLSNATTSSFSYTATAGDVTATAVNTADKSMTINAQAGTLALVNVDTTTGAMDFDASGNITVTTNGGVTASSTGTININSSGGYIRNSAVSDGTADISSAGGSITLEAATGIADSAGTAGLDIDSGSGAVTITDDGAGSIFVDYTSTDGDAVTLTLTQSNAGNVTYDSLSHGMLTVNASALSGAANSVSISNDASITLAGALTTTNGAITLDAATGNIDTNDQTVTAGSGAITFISDSIDLGTTADKITTTSTMTLRLTTASKSIGIAGGSGDYNLTAAEIAAIVNGGSGISIGVDGGTGAVDINDVTFNDNTTIYGGTVTIDNVTATGNTFTLDSTGAVTDGNAGTNNVTATTLNITAYGGIGSADALETTVTTLRLINNDVIASTSAIQATNTGTLTLNGATNYDAGNITVIASSPLTVSADVITTGNGNITLTATEDGGADDTLTVNADITIKTDQGDIALTAGQNIDLSAGGILIQTSGDDTITLNADIDGALNDGDILMAATDLIQTLGNGAITLNADDDLTITNIIGGGAVTINSTDGGATGIISLNGNVTNTSGTITFSDAVNLTGASVVSSTNGNVTFTGTVNGAATLEADADNGTVTFSSTIGDGADPTAMTLNADTVVFNNSVSVAGNIDINANNVTLDTASSGSFTTTGGTAGYIDFGTALIDSAGEAVAFVITTDTTGNVVLGTVGSSDPVASLAVTSGGSTTLNGNITADGAAGITFANAVNVLLANNVTLTTNTSTGDVVLDSVNGAKSLTVNSVGDITLNDDIGGTVNLTSVTLNAADVINVNAGGDITSTGAVYLSTAGDAATDDINLAANVIGSSVTFDTTGGTPGDTVITTTQNNTSGLTTYDGLVEINGAGVTLTSLEDMTFNGAVTVTAINAGGITSTNGSLDFNADLSGGQTINLNAASGSINLTTVGVGADPTLLDLDSLTAELSGAVGVVAIDTTGVGLTTLAADVGITATGAAGILLGDLDGAKTLTLIASNAAGVITLLDADIGALSITDADAVNFNGNFVTSGAVTVGTSITNNITVANTGSIQAGGNIGLDNTAGAGTFDIVLNGNVSTTGSSTITISADDAVNIAQTAAASVNAVNGEIDITAPGDIALGTGAIAGQIVTTGTGLIDLNITGPGHVDIRTASGNKISGGGGVDIAGIATIAGEVMATNAGNVLFNNAVTLAGNSTVGSDNGNVTFTSTVGGAFNLAANAPNGIVTFSSTVGAVTNELTLLTVTANEARLAGNISTDGGTTADIDFRGTTLVTLTADITLDTETGSDAIGGDVLFKTSGSIVGDFDLIINATGTANGTLQINDADVDQFTTTGVLTATLYGRIESDDAISLDGAATVTLADTVTLVTTNAEQNISIDNTALNGQQTLSITSTGDVALDAVTQLTGLTVVADTIDFTDAVSIPGSISVTVSDAAVTDAIDVQAAVDSTDGSVTFNTAANSGAELNAALSAGQNVTINGLTTLATGAIIITADNGNIALNGDLRGAQNATLAATNGNVEINTVGGGTDPTLLDINSATATLDGATIVTAGNILLDGVGLTTLNIDVSMTSGGNAINLGSLDGDNDLTLVAGGGAVTLRDADIASLTVTSADTVLFSGGTTFNTAGVVNIVAAATSVTITGNIIAGGDIDITNVGNAITIDGNVTGATLDVNDAATLASTTISATGNVAFVEAVTLTTGASTVGSTAGNVTFTSTVGGAQSLTVNASSGIVTFSSTVGAVTDELTLLTVTANEARLAGNISTDGGTTADIDFRGTDLVTLTAAVILDTETAGNDVAGDILFGASSSVAGAFGLTVNADSAAGDGNFQINDADIGQFTISASSVTTATLYGTIISDNAIDLSGAATITLGDTANLQTTAADQDITIGTGAAASTLNGAHPLTITASGDVSFDVVNALTGLTIVADTVDFTDAVSMPGDITVTTWTAADLDEIDVQAAFDSTNGSITFTGRTELNNAAFSAGQNITLNSDTRITTSVVITADNGYIDLNAAVNEAVAIAAGTDSLTLTAPFGTVYARELGTTKSLNVLDVNSLAAELAGNITAVAVDTTGVGLSTLTADITITASGAAGILLSDLDGAKTLTLIASNAAGVITLLDADIGALSITDSNTVNFNGNFVTGGAASVTGVDGEIDVAAAGSVQSGGSVTFTTTGAGTVIDINGPVSSEVDISFDASTAGTISVDSTVTAKGIITMLADVDLNINAAVNSTMAGNIIMTADTGDINLSDEVRTTSTGDVSLTATLGSIIDADVATEDERIAGDVVTLTALENIGTAVAGADIDTEANSLDISSTDAATARTIVIDEYDAVVLTDLDTALGSITVSADGLITATDVNASGAGEDVTLTTTTGGMILTSVLADDDITATADAGDITIALVGDAGTDDIAITATTGAIDEVAPEDVGVDIVGDVVTLTAQNGIGHARKLETTIASLDASVTSTGDIQIAETNAIILTDLDTVDGSITVSAGGLITATDVNASGVNQDVTLTTTAGGIILTSVLADDDITVTADAGDITIDVAGDAGTDDLTITATTGSINGVDIDAAAEITGDAIVLTAQDEIGGASGGATEIETEVTTISADSTAAGDIIFEELDADDDGINLLSIDTNNGNITIVTNGMTHEAGTETIITSVKSDTGVAGANDISITASTGDITLVGNAADASNVQSDDDITIVATAGSITEDASVEIPGDSYVDIQGDKLTITARDEIGSSTGEYDIETTIANLDASSTTAGDIVITETNAIGLDDVDTANGAITIVAGGAIVATDVVSTTDADANDITITATAGDVTIGVITAGAGVTADASITATTGSINEIGAGDAAVDITADVLTLSCQDEIGGPGELDIETTVNSLTASSTLAGDTYITETNAITLTSIITTDGLITIISGGNMTVTSVTAGGDTGSNDDVTLTTTTGDIIMSGDITALNDTVTLTSAGNITDTTSGATDISAADLVITANAGTVGAAGANNELDTDVDTITAAVNGAIYILEDSAVSLPSVVTVAGLIDIEAAGTITTTTVTANGGFGVNLYATAGNLLDTAGGMITATSESNLKASGVVGTNANPMDVNIDGKLWILAGSMQDEVSANVTGTVNGGDATERVEILLPAPPGLVLLDNHLMGGGNYGSGSPNGTILSRGYGYTAIIRADMFSAVYQQGLQPWGHKMMLPWVLSEGARIDDDFLNSLPAVIDVSQLNLPVLNGGSQTANFYVIRSLK